VDVTSRHDETTQPSLEALETRRAAGIKLLVDLGVALHRAALPASIVETRTRAVADALGVHADVFVLQGFLCVESEGAPVERIELRRTDFDAHWNIARLHELLELSTSIVRGDRGVTAGRDELERILAEPRRFRKGLVVLAYGVYGGAVAARVGGNRIEVLAGALIGLVAGVIHYETGRYKSVDLQKSFLAALVGCLVAFALTLVLPPLDVGRALFGGITLLVPAMVLTIATYELANDAVESGVGRIAYALLRFLMLGFGIAVAMRVFPLLAPLPPQVTSTALPTPLTLLLVAIGGASLTVCLQGRRRDLPWMAAAALFAFGTQELTKALFGGRGSPMLSAFLLGIAGNFYARLTDKIPATFVIPGLLQLAPGFLGTQAVFDLLGGGGSSAVGAQEARFFDVFMTSLQLVTGLLLADVLAGRAVRARFEHVPAASH
jgi:uncharacterized membrane protein YjjP (DUF1212 family)